jgi:hypothetical protein
VIGGPAKPIAQAVRNGQIIPQSGGLNPATVSGMLRGKQMSLPRSIHIIAQCGHCLKSALMTKNEHNISLNSLLCQECGGRCCQGSPGIWIDPERFFALFFSGKRVGLSQLRERLPGLGLVLWENSDVPIPAPRSLSSGCAFLEEDGCRFPASERPCQCLALIPDKTALELQTGCPCRLPADFSLETGRQRWQDYWRAADTIASLTLCQTGDKIDLALPPEDL